MIIIESRTKGIDECQILYIWAPKFAFIKSCTLLFSYIFG
jgi:hypothetical protein